MFSEIEKDHLWRLYKTGVEQGSQPSLEKLGIRGLRFERENRFMAPISGGEGRDYRALIGLIRHWESIYEPAASASVAGDGTARPQTKSNERKMLELGLAQFDAAYYRRDLKSVQSIFDSGFPINFQHPGCGSSLLHIAAMTHQEDLIRWLLNIENCNFLLLDNRQMMPIDKARFYYGRDEIFIDLFLKPTSTQLMATTTRESYYSDLTNRVQKWRHSEWYQEEMSQAEAGIIRKYLDRWLP